MAQRRHKKSHQLLTNGPIGDYDTVDNGSPDMSAATGIKCVELLRTGHGFGFTLSGEMPSILTHVKGSAHWSGLRSGDYLMTVQEMDVLHMSHEQIVELIQRQPGPLRLQCLPSNGNYLSSNTSTDSDQQSDSDDYRMAGSHTSSHRKLPPQPSVLQRPASQCSSTHRYRHNSRHDGRHNQTARHHRTISGHKLHNDNELTNRLMMDSTPRNYRSSQPPIHMQHTVGRAVGRTPFGVHSKTNEPLIDLLLEQKLSQIKCGLSESDSNNSLKTNSLTKSYQNNYNSGTNPVSKQQLNRKTSATISEDMTAADVTLNGTIRRTTSDTTVDTMSRALKSRKQSDNMYGESMASAATASVASIDADIDDLHSRALLRAIVGYSGTIETPVDSHIDAQLIKDCIRRIRVENKQSQTTTLLAVYQDSVHLVNARGRTIGQFAADSLKSCGICADDSKYFAIITASAMPLMDNSVGSGGHSCHVFITSESTHQTHYQTAQHFRIKCTLDPITSHCLEFPESADAILRVIVGLYRNKVGCAPTAMSTADPNLSSPVSNGANGPNSSSNSDSGITENSRSPDANHHPIGGRNQSYNSERLEAQLNAANVRQTVQKYLLLKHDLKQMSAYNGDPPVPQPRDRQQLLSANSASKMSVSSTIHGSSYSVASTGKSSCDNKSAVIMPATLSKENLELNNEITSGYDLDTKSSMSLEGMPPMSDTVSAASASVVSERPIDVGWVGGWAQDFEKLLSDSIGVKAFAEFLKKEFSHENLQFWMSCEKYKLITDETQMNSEAKALYDRHLSSGAPEAVNIDGRARLLVETALDRPTPDLFSAAEKQIYNLMKFDCYQRFLKSNIYKECVALELQGRPLPYESMDTDDSVGGNGFKNSQINTIKPKKRSFIPWHRIKSSKAEKQLLKRLSAKQTYVRCKSVDPELQQRREASANRSDITGSQSSLATSASTGGILHQKYLMSKSNDSLHKSMPNIPAAITATPTGSDHCQDNDCHLLCVLLPDRSQSVVPLVDGQTVGQMIEHLLEKRGLNYSAFDTFVTGSDKSLDPSVDVSTLGCKELRVEQRVLFQIDFPNREIIGIKARTSKTCGDVFGPLLAKYGYKLEHIVLQIANSSEVVTNDLPIARLDNQRIIVSISDDLEEWGWDCTSSRMPVAVDKSRTTPAPPPVVTDDDKPIRILNDSMFDTKSAIKECTDRNSWSEKENCLPVSATPTVESQSLAVKKVLADNCLTIDGQNYSFSDDTKSEQFFRDLMLASQHLPVKSPISSLKTSAKGLSYGSTTTTTPAIKPVMRRAINNQYFNNNNNNNNTNNMIKNNNNFNKDLMDKSLTACDLSPIEPPPRLTLAAHRPEPAIMNDIDLDATLKSIQMYNMRNSGGDKTHSPSAIPYPHNHSLMDTSAANFTPPPPVRSIGKHYIPPPLPPNCLTSPNAPPLPPKPIGNYRSDRGPPPRPPPGNGGARHTAAAQAIQANNAAFVRSLDKTIDSNVIFV